MPDAMTLRNDLQLLNFFGDHRDALQNLRGTPNGLVTQDSGSPLRSVQTSDTASRVHNPPFAPTSDYMLRRKSRPREQLKKRIERFARPRTTFDPHDPVPEFRQNRMDELLHLRRIPTNTSADYAACRGGFSAECSSTRNRKYRWSQSLQR